MDQNTKDILGTVNFIKDRMLSKDAARTIIREEFPGMIREELKPIHHELKEINKSIDVSTCSTKNTRIARGSRRRSTNSVTRCGRSRSNSGSTERFQRKGARSVGRSRLKSRDGSASKSRLRGQSDEGRRCQLALVAWELT
jgi:hypothetical protein